MLEQKELQTKTVQTIPALNEAIKIKDLALIGAVVVSWGVAFTGMKQMVHYAPPLTAGGLRFFIGALPLVYLALQPRRLKQLKPADFLKLLFLGLCQTGVVFGLNFLALQHISAGLSSILLNTNPFFVAILAHFLIKGDGLTRSKLAGLLLGFGGVCVLVLGGQGMAGDGVFWILVALLAGAAWGFSSILVKLFGFKDMVSLTGWQLLFGSVPMLLLGFGFESSPVDWNGTMIFWTLFTGLVSTSFGWLAWYGLLSRYPATRISVFLFLSPVFGVLSGILILGEALTLNLFLGGALVAGGIALVNLRWKLGGRLKGRLARSADNRLVQPSPQE